MTRLEDAIYEEKVTHLERELNGLEDGVVDTEALSTAIPETEIRKVCDY